MLYLNYGYNVFWTVQEIQWKVFSGLSSNWKRKSLYCLNKLRRRELYQIQISEKYKKTNFAVVLWRVFQQSWFQLETNISFTTLVTVDTKWRVFQYKIVNSILFVNKMLFKLRKHESPLCSFCKAEDKAYIHLFHRCRKTSILWRQLQ